MTSRKKRALFIGTGSIFCIILVVHFLFQQPGEDQSKVIPEIPEQAIEKFSITETEAGKPHWVLEASSAQIMENEKKVLLQFPVVKFYEEGRYVSTLSAASGRINTENYDIWAEGKCLLNTAKGERLETSNLRYRSDIKKVVTDDPVKLVRANEVVHGQGLEASPDLSSIKIRKQRVEVSGTNE